MAQMLDDFGRAVKDATMSLDALRGVIRSLAQGNTGKATSRKEVADKAGLPSMPEPNPANEKAIGEIKELLKTYFKDYAKDEKDGSKWADDMIDLMKDLVKNKEEKKKNPDEKKKKKEPRVKTGASEKSAMALTGGIKSFDVRSNATRKELTAIMKKLDPAVQILKGSAKGDFKMQTTATPEAMGQAANGAGKHIEIIDPKATKNMYALESSLRNVENQVNKVQDALMGFEVGKSLFKGVVKEETEFIRKSREAAFEVDGITKETRGLQRAYEDIGTTAKTTGMDRSAYQKEYLKNIKRGIKDLGVANKVTTASLNTERMIGVEAGLLSDTFGDWNQAMRMNASQVADMGRGIRDVAKYTGVTGEKLAAAVNHSQEFIKVMRNAATLSATAAKNIIEIQAVAQKMGTTDTLNPLMKAMTNTNSLIRDASMQTKALLFNAAAKTGRIGDLMNGTILKSKKGINDMAKGLEANLKMFGVNSLEEIDQLSDDAKMKLNLQLKAAFGIELGEMRQTIETLKEAGKGMAERLTDINKKMGQNLTVEEKKALMEQARSMKASKSLEVLTAIDEAAKGAKNMDQALAKFGERRKDFEDDLRAMGISATDNADVARKAIGSAVENINSSLKKSGKQEIKIDSSQIENALKDPVAFRELQATLTKAEQQAAVAQKSQLDPMSEIKQKVTEINDTLRNMSQNVLSKLMNSMLGKLALIAVAILSVLTTAALFVSGLMLLKTQIETLGVALKGLPGGIGNMAKSFGGWFKGLTSKVGDLANKLTGRDKTKAVTPTPKLEDLKRENPLKTPTAMAETAKVEKPAEVKPLEQIIALLKRIADCVCKEPAKAATDAAPAAAAKANAAPEKAAAEAGKAAGKQKLSPEEIASRKAAGQAAKQKDADAGISPAVAKSIKRQEVKNIKMDKTLNIMERKNQIQDLHNGKKTGKQIALEQKSKAVPQPPAAPAPTGPPEGGWDIKKLQESGPEMAKTAAAILVMAVGVVALGAAIVFLSHKVLKSFNLDMSTVLQTAAVVGAIALAGGAIAMGAISVIKALEEPETQEFVKKAKTSYKDLLKTAAAILVIGPAVVLLGAAVIAVTAKILKMTGLNISTVAETAGIVVAVAAAATAIIAGSSAAMEAMETMDKLPGVKKLMKNPMKMAWTMIKAGAAILIVGPAIILLGAAIIKFAQWILGSFNLDAKTAASVGLTTAAVVLSAGLIAAGVAGAVAGLYGLGKLAKLVMKDPTFLTTLAWGAAAFVVLAPIILLLAAAVIKFSQWILGAFNLTAKQAAETGFAVAAIIFSAALIAGGIIGAVAGLLGLGLLIGLISGPQVALMFLGAKAFAFLTPAILALAVGVVKICEGLMGAFGINMGQAATVAGDVAAIILSAAVIAGGVIGAIAGLWGLGLLAMMAKAIVPMVILGTIALLMLTPAILRLAIAVVKISEGVMAKLDIDMGKAVTVAKNVAGVLAAAAFIAIAVIGAIAGLWGLGLLAMMAKAIVPMVILGAIALLLLTPAILTLANAVIWIAGKMVQMDPKEIETIVNGVESIIDGAAHIASAVVGAAASLTLFGFMLPFSYIVALMMMAGTKALTVMAAPLVAYLKKVVEIAQELGKSLPPKQACEMATGVAAMLGAAGDVTDQIMLAKDKLIRIKVSKGFWIFSTSTVDAMNNGVAALEVMREPLVAYLGKVVEIAKEIGKSLPPKQACEMATGVAAILNAAGDVTDQIMLAKDKLIRIKVSKGFWIFSTSTVDAMNNGVAALEVMRKPLVAYLGKVVEIAKEIGGELSPKQTCEMAKGVAAILNAAGDVTDQIMLAKDKLIRIKVSKGFWIFSTSTVDAMNNGVAALEVMREPLVAYLGKVVEIAKELGGELSPKQTCEMAKGVAAMLGAAGDVTDQIMLAKDKLIRIKVSKGFWIFSTSTVDAMNNGVAALEVMREPLVAYLGKVVEIAKELGGELSPKQTVSMAKGVAAILGACGEVTEQIMLAKDKLVAIKSSKGFWIFATSIVESMNKGVTALEAMKDPIINYVGTIVGFATEMGSKVKPDQAKGLMKSLYAVGMIVEMTGKVLDDLNSKIIPLTQGTFFTESPLQKMETAKKEMDKIFPTLTTFVKGIVTNMSAMGDFDSLKEANKKLVFAAAILQSVGPSLTIMGRQIVPLTEPTSFFDRKSPIKKMKDATKNFGDLFDTIAKFINTGIVVPINAGIADIGKLKEAGVKMMIMAQMLNAVGISISVLSQVMSVMEPKSLFDKKSPMEKMAADSGKFETWFKTLALFINTGIINAIGQIKNMDELKKTSDIMKAVAPLLCGVVGTIKGLADVMSLMDSTSIFSYSPMKKIMKNKGQFEEWFKAVAKFVLTGIVTPVTTTFSSGTKGIQDASIIIAAMAVVAKNIVPMITNLVAAVGLAMKGSDFFEDAPMKKIVDNTTTFSGWFKSIAIFMRDGIVNPVLDQLGDSKLGVKKIVMAATIMQAMANIIQLIPKVILGISNGLIPLIDGGMKMEDTPKQKLEKHTKKFGEWFESIAIFMRNGIVRPVLDELGDGKLGVKKIVMAARIMSAMAAIIGVIPKVINGVVTGLIPLIDSGMTLDQTPKDKLDKQQDKFKDWFSSVTNFMKEGIVRPILDKLDKDLGVKEIVMAARIMYAMGTIIGALPKVIRGLAMVFGPMDPKDCLSQSPMAMIAASTTLFGGWFKTLAVFLRIGIIQPILEQFPDMKEVESVRKSLVAMVNVVRFLPQFLFALAQSIFPMVSGTWMRASPIQLIGSAVIMFGAWFSAVANALVNGIIVPLGFFPKQEDLAETFDSMQAMAGILANMPPFLEDLSEQMAAINGSAAWGLASQLDVVKFSDYFLGLSTALKMGIIEPLEMYMPDTGSLQEAVTGITALDSVMGAMAEALAGLNATIAKLNQLDMVELDKGSIEKFNGILAAPAAPMSPETPTPPTTPTPPETPQVRARPQTNVERWQEKMGRKSAAKQKGTAKELPQKSLTIPDDESNDPSSEAIQKKMQKKSIDAQKKSSSSLDELALSASKPSGLNVSDIETQNLLKGFITFMGNLFGQSKEPGTASAIGQMSMPLTASSAEKELVPGAAGKPAPGYRLAQAASAELEGRKATMSLGQKDLKNAIAMPPNGLDSSDRASSTPQVASQAGQNQPPTVQTLPPQKAEMDLQRKVAQDRTTSQPPASTMSSPELSQIAATSQLTQTGITQMVGLLSALVGYMKPESSKIGNSDGGGQMSGGTDAIVSSPPKYYKWSTGKHNQTAGKAVTNMGAPSS